ncbi:Lysophospholipase, alpha-beta hydrolase superfamily [Pseudomonas linyingensis]|uniref:Lysophospholipase, alpha-beta hydrolase superfamily n=1 Tax=Pseudomonas linyingensis TaxID=915471 RepID=A0A1H7CJ94_9PSED|nr:alpha/beta hydrolase [Pseudomonas linyingensis]SEJ85745.1 Lysophospholipase, alpha-beta hydrolase superfamily [Pseudomonas linyingensis]
MNETFDPQRLRQQMPPLSAAAAEHGPQVQAYRQYYGLQHRPDIHSRLGWVEVGGRRLAVQGWWRDGARATLLLLHGYYDHMGLYRHVFDWALAMNFAVLSCDLPGHGLSEGVPASIDDFAEYQAVLAALFEAAEMLNLPQPWHLFGQSTGGAILLDYLLTGAPRPNLGQTVLLSPLIRPRAWRRSKLSYHLLNPFVSQIARRFTDNSSDSAFLDFVRRDPLQAQVLPTAWVGALARWIPRIENAPRSAGQSPLIIQGDADMTVDWQHNLEVLGDKFRDPEQLILPGARHHLVNEDEAQRQRLFALLNERFS